MVSTLMNPVSYYLYTAGYGPLPISNLLPLSNKPKPVSPTRLAVAAKVPLLMVIPVFYGNAVKFTTGPCPEPHDDRPDSFSVMRNLIYYLESEIKKDPSIWPEYVC